MSPMAYQLTGVSIVCSTVGLARIKENIKAPLLAFLRRIHRLPVKSPHKRLVTGKMFPIDDVIMQHIEIFCAIVLPDNKSFLNWIVYWVEHNLRYIIQLAASRIALIGN